jgi:hypothetical protein
VPHSRIAKLVLRFSPTHSVPLPEWWARRSAFALPVKKPVPICHPWAGDRVVHCRNAKVDPRFSPTHTLPLLGW